MEKIDIEAAKVIIKLINEHGDTLTQEQSMRIYELISEILAKYGYKIPPIKGA